MRTKLCRLIREGIKDEAEGITFYKELLKESLSVKDKQAIRSIDRDEKAHKKVLERFDKKYCK